MTTFMNNIIISFPCRRDNTMAAADRACPNSTCHCFGCVRGPNGRGTKTEVFVPSVLFVGFLILSCRPYCVRTASPPPLSRSSAPRDPWRHNTVSLTKITDTDYVLYISYRRYRQIIRPV